MGFNMWLTKRTYDTDPGTQRQPHIHFCTIVGGEISPLLEISKTFQNLLGFCSFLSPCLALFFNQTTSARNLNYFYKVGMKTETKSKTKSNTKIKKSNLFCQAEHPCDEHPLWRHLCYPRCANKHSSAGQRYQLKPKNKLEQ